MAYSPVNNSVFSTEEVGDGADVAQLNDNIEDTRARVATLENAGSVLVAYETEYTWLNHSDVGYGVGSSFLDPDIELTIEAPDTTTTFPTGATYNMLDASNDLDLNGLIYGDRVIIRLEFEAFGGIGGANRDYIVKLVLTDGTVFEKTITGSGSRPTDFLEASFKTLEPMIGIAKFYLAGAGVGSTRQIKPTKLTISIN